jgi:hypothetical protein
VCSIEDGAIAEVIRAIDQLAEDAGQGLEADEMSARVAAVWGMLSALDPELARLRAAYEAPERGPGRASGPRDHPEG